MLRHADGSLLPSFGAMISRAMEHDRRTNERLRRCRQLGIDDATAGRPCNPDQISPPCLLMAERSQYEYGWWRVEHRRRERDAKRAGQPRLPGI